jgi:phosphatidylserine/phosphatidylglycerophosphate/cardiolipin synthase-like enzyme
MSKIEIIIGEEFPKKVIPLIDSAKNSIDIVVFDWLWYPQNPGSSVQLFNQSIIRAVRRGVKVRAIANNYQIINRLKSFRIEAKRLSCKGLVHCKVMIIDDEVAVVGSHNYTQGAFTMNYELSVAFEITDEAKTILTFFNNLWSL